MKIVAFTIPLRIRKNGVVSAGGEGTKAKGSKSPGDKKPKLKKPRAQKAKGLPGAQKA